MKKTLLRLTLAALVAVAPGLASADYGFSPGSKVRVGSAFDPVNPERQFLNSFYEVPPAPSTPNDQADITATFSEVRNRSSLHDALQLNAYASARYGAFSGKGAYSKLNKMTFDSDTVTIAMVARKTFASDVLGGSVRLSPDGKEELAAVTNAEDAYRFLYLGGSEIVTSTTKGGFVYVVYQFHSSKQESLSRVYAAFSASYGGPVGGASAGASQLRELLRSNTDIKVEWTVLSEGVSNAKLAEGLETLITSSAGDVAAVKTAMSQMVNAITPSSAKVLSFQTTSVKSLAALARSPAGKLLRDSEGLEEKRRQAALAVVDKLQDLNAKSDMVAYLLNAPRQYLVEVRRTNLEEVARRLEAARTRARAMAGDGDADDSGSSSLDVPDFDPIWYVNLPLVRYVGYDTTWNWAGRRNCNADDKKAQCNYLTWDYTPKFEVTLPALTKSLRFEAQDGSFAYDYAWLPAGGYGVQVNASIGGYLHFGKQTWTFGDNILVGDGRKNVANSKRVELLGESPAGSKLFTVKVVDVSNRSMAVSLFGLRDVDTPKNVAFKALDYGPLIAGCLNENSLNTVCAIR